MADLKNVSQRRALLFMAYLWLVVGLTFQIFVTLSGAVQGNLINLIYFLQADTSAIPGAPTVARWTYFAICDVSNGHNADCRDVKPALAFDPPDNFGTADRVPSALITNSTNRFLSKCMFAFFLVALFFATATLFGGLSASVRVDSTKLHRMLGGVLTFFQLGGCLFMTAWTVRGRDAFEQSGAAANLGASGFGFTWGAFVCYNFFLGFIVLADRVSKTKPPPMTRERYLEEESGLVGPSGVGKEGHF